MRDLQVPAGLAPIAWQPPKGYTGHMSDVSERVEEMQDRLDEIQEEIDEARADAENVNPQRPKETFVEIARELSESDAAAMPPG